MCLVSQGLLAALYLHVCVVADSWYSFDRGLHPTMQMREMNAGLYT